MVTALLTGIGASAAGILNAKASRHGLRTARPALWSTLIVAVVAGCDAAPDDDAQEATCDDGIHNGLEEGLDCGGDCGACPSCDDGLQNGSETGVDCGGVCQAPCSGCDDGIQNGPEEGVDCGGDCLACPTCDDGIHNGGEAAIDCGGDCLPCPTCVDGLMNGDELGIDCGGACPACASCFDGVQNGTETGIDCGGSCAACPTCSDGVQNGGEAGRDCGGPCPAACPSCSDGLQNGGESGVDCGGPCADCVNCVPDAMRVFVTSTGYDADLGSHVGVEGGLAGGDAICALHASAAGLGGTWRAWLSDGNEDAVDRVADVGPWYFVDRCTQATGSMASLLVSGPERILDRDENGANVTGSRWTGTTKSGRNYGLDCGDWTSSFGGEGLIGLGYYDTDTFPEWWTDGPSNPCDFSNRLICFEQ